MQLHRPEHDSGHRPAGTSPHFGAKPEFALGDFEVTLGERIDLPSADVSLSLLFALHSRLLNLLNTAGYG